MEKMRIIKRGGDDLTRRLHKNRRGCNGGGETTDSLISGDLLRPSNHDVWTELSDEVKSKLSKSVVSLALCNGDKVVFSCSGIAMKRQGNVTEFVTSARLVRAFNATKLTKNGHDNLKIEVRHEGNEVHQGFLAEYNLDHNFVVVYIMTSLDVHAVLLQHVEEILPCSKVVSVGRAISGKLMSTSVILTHDLSGSEDNDEDCKISEVWVGGPLFCFDGNLVGMNLLLVKERAYFLPWGTILTRLEQFRKSLLLKRMNTVWVVRGSDEIFSCHSKDICGQKKVEDLDSMGYPKPPSDDGMVLTNTFEETFGDAYGEGVWSELSKTACSNINRSVVALASFKGETRFFACTGFFIEWNNRADTIVTSASLIRDSDDESKIEENLRIKVLLPGRHGRIREGTLLHYSLHYNVALVSVKGFRAVRPASCHLQWDKCSTVVAVGRCFESGQLMAAYGLPVSWTGTLDFEFIMHSSCRTTKAGIGGPLVDRDGKVIGMNFYDKRVGTPFLFWYDVHRVLAYFERKSTKAELLVGNNASGNPSAAGARFWRMRGGRRARLNRWPVPMPCWRHPDVLDPDEEDDLEFDELCGGPDANYGYSRGVKVVYV